METHFQKNSEQISDQLMQTAQIGIDEVFLSQKSRADGLSPTEVASRLKQYGANEIAQEKPKSIQERLWDNVKNPLVILLTVLGAVSYATGDVRSTVVIMAMVLLGIALRFYQEMRADNAADKLKAMVSTKATAVRDGKEVVKKDVSIKIEGTGSSSTINL